jgi:hypothetical protein
LPWSLERVIALEAYDKGLLGTTLRYPYEVRKAEDYFCDLPDLTIAPDLLTLARQGHRFRPLDLPRPLREPSLTRHRFSAP